MWITVQKYFPGTPETGQYHTVGARWSSKGSFKSTYVLQLKIWNNESDIHTITYWILHLCIQFKNFRMLIRKQYKWGVI